MINNSNQRYSREYIIELYCFFFNYTFYTLSQLRSLQFIDDYLCTFFFLQKGATARLEEPEGACASNGARTDLKLIRATLSPEIDRQIREDCFNLDHLLDIANSFNQDNAYGALELCVTT